MQLSGRILVFMGVSKEGGINHWYFSQSLLFLANILGKILGLQRWVKLVFLRGHLAVSLGVLLVLILFSGCWLVCTLNECCQELGKQDLQTCPWLLLCSATPSGRSVTRIGRGKEFWVFYIQLESFPVWCVNWWFAGRKYSGLWKTATASWAL